MRRRLNFLGRTTPLISVYQLAFCEAFSIFRHVPLHLELGGSRPSTPAKPREFQLNPGSGFPGVGTLTPLPRQKSNMGLQATTLSEEKQEDPSVVGEDERAFQWRRQWYPIGVTRDLEAMDPRQPYPVKLLGEDFVAWKEPKTGEWKAFVDRCPHRWAPLSEGRVDQQTGRLQCVYHGWEFEGDGRCASIPQANERIRGNAQASPRACVAVLPTKIVQGKLWLWPDGSPEGVEESKLSDPAIVEEIDREGFDGTWYVRDLPYGYDTLVENLADPAHVPFAHHGVIVPRAFGSIPMDIVMERGLGADELRTKPTGYLGKRNLVVGFKAPSLIYYRSDFTEMFRKPPKSASGPIRALTGVMKTLRIGARAPEEREDKTGPSDPILAYFVGYAVPTIPGRCRIFTRTARNFIPGGRKSIFSRWRNSVAREHLSQHLVLDGDSYLLHRQERMLLEAGKHGSADTERMFYMPTDTDSPVRAFRNWFFKRAGGSPAWAEGVDPSALGPVLPHDQVLERYESHTKQCSVCSRAYEVLNKVKVVSIGGAVVALAAAAVVPRGALAICLAGTALGSSGLALNMARRAQQFVHVDYVHATRDG